MNDRIEEESIKLPKSELKRIDEAMEANLPMQEYYQSNFGRGLAEAKRITFVEGVRIEAFLWYERMGKFAEMAGAVTIGDERYFYVSMAGFWYCYKDKAALTTPELINEFLNQLNEGK